MPGKRAEDFGAIVKNSGISRGAFKEKHGQLFPPTVTHPFGGEGTHGVFCFDERDPRMDHQNFSGDSSVSCCRVMDPAILRQRGESASVLAVHRRGHD